jgi:hypothetical protein
MLVFGLQRWKCSIVSKVQQIDHDSFASDVSYAITWTHYVNPASLAQCALHCLKSAFINTAVQYVTYVHPQQSRTALVAVVLGGSTVCWVVGSH